MTHSPLLLGHCIKIHINMWLIWKNRTVYESCVLTRASRTTDSARKTLGKLFYSNFPTRMCPNTKIISIVQVTDLRNTQSVTNYAQIFSQLQQNVSRIVNMATTRPELHRGNPDSENSCSVNFDASAGLYPFQHYL